VNLEFRIKTPSSNTPFHHLSADSASGAEERGEEQEEERAEEEGEGNEGSRSDSSVSGRDDKTGSGRSGRISGSGSADKYNNDGGWGTHLELGLQNTQKDTPGHRNFTNY
jgi:hypothetical protein